MPAQTKKQQNKAFNVFEKPVKPLPSPAPSSEEVMVGGEDTQISVKATEQPELVGKWM